MSELTKILESRTNMLTFKRFSSGSILIEDDDGELVFVEKAQLDDVIKILQSLQE